MAKTRENNSAQEHLDFQELLSIADGCFEVFTARELEVAAQVVHEILRSYPEMSAERLRGTLELAVSWKHVLRSRSQVIN